MNLADVSHCTNMARVETPASFIQAKIPFRHDLTKNNITHLKMAYFTKNSNDFLRTFLIQPQKFTKIGHQVFFFQMHHTAHAFDRLGFAVHRKIGVI